MGKDMACPPVVYSTMADQATPSLDALQALFDAPWEAVTHLGPTVRWEPDPTLSEFMSYSWDLPLGVPLHAVLPTTVKRHCIQMLCYLDAEPDFAVDFCLPSPMASSQPLRLPYGRWELSTSI